ncbi:hypothetical protein B0H67DRAFT_642986 [Lasiosphaeris hirsuta]|uniref:Polyamine transport protein n=1 Tax=Lasiosphaeris hirsuta TaxID=260670 RepID=A0AA40APL8_9PEZI|nr:hypothetical protein B0H67DRAFT_642986 [Lasiosphaeris hirsuta]
MSSPAHRIQGLVCIDPQIHSAESHAQVHHPGLLKGADFCDSGVEVASDSPIELPDKGWHLFPFDEKVEDDSEGEIPIIGRMYRALTGGDICETLVDISAHRHHGHSSAVKVRPTIGISHFVESGHRGHHGMSKVGPLCQLPPFQYPEHVLLLPGSPRSIIDPVPLIDQEGFKPDPMVEDISADDQRVTPEDEDDAAAPEDDARPPPGKHESKRTSWLRDLIKASEPYKTKLTDFPDKRRSLGNSNRRLSSQATVKRDSAIPRDLAGNSTASVSIDTKFRKTINNLEHLLDEAIVLANEAADREDHQCTDNHELAQANPYDAPNPPPSVHESVPSADESSNDENLAKNSHDGALVKVTGEETPNKQIPRRYPKHYRSAPGMRSKNTAVNVPKRTSSLMKSKVASRDAVSRLPPQNRLKEQRWLNINSDRRLRKKRSSEIPPEEVIEDTEEETSEPSGCLTGGKIVRKIRNYRRPLAQRQSSLQNAKGEGQNQAKKNQPGTFSNPFEGAIRESGSWSFDGAANDEDIDWSTGHGFRQVAGGAQTSHEKSMNFHSILMDLFGASLMSGNPHQEVVDKFDVRRHGGGMGVWLGIWTWCFTGSLGIGFLIGAAIINTLNPSWGFYVSIMLVAVVLLLNVLCPEVRRSPYRRSVAEVRNGNKVSRRIARGEVMMHRVKDGPTWWWQEVYHGVFLSLEMLRQPGFMVMALYSGWIYAQIVLIIVLLGSLTSRYYMLFSPLVGLCVSFISIGALIAVPFQKANIFSRGRHHQEPDTLNRKVTWTSHLLRRAIFCIVLPLAGIAYAAASAGPPMPVAIPVLLAALVGNLSGLAMSECNGLIMETFDTSDLQPGMTGRPRGTSNKSSKRTNYSSFPRVTAGFAVCHTIGFVLAAVATAIGGVAQRNLGQRTATGIVAGILLVLTVLLLAVLIRFKEVEIIPRSKTLEMEKWTQLRRQSTRRLSSAGKSAAEPNTMSDADIWRPALMGNPSSRLRRVNILELGAMTRWTEIRKKNRLIDESAAHLNRAALESAAVAVEQATGIGAMTTDLVRRVSSRRSNRNGQNRRFHSGSPSPPGGRANAPRPMELGTMKKGDGQALDGSLFPDHGKTRGAGEDYSERECVMGQTLMEENESSDREGEFIYSSWRQTRQTSPDPHSSPLPSPPTAKATPISYSQRSSEPEHSKQSMDHERSDTSSASSAAGSPPSSGWKWGSR